MRLCLFLVSILLNSLAISAPMKYTAGSATWNSDTLGNHRFVIRFAKKGFGSAPVVRAFVPWRQRMPDPEKRGFMLVDGKTGERVMNVKVLTISQKNLEFLFEPVSGPGNYFLYYMLYKNEGRANYPKGTYRAMDSTRTARWDSLAQPNKPWPAATVVEYQGIDEFNAFSPMEFIAGPEEIRNLVMREKNAPFLLFAESRMNPVRMRHDLPVRWIERAPAYLFVDTARRGEFFSYQIGVYAVKGMQGVNVSFSDLTNKRGAVIPSSRMNCYNTGGVSYTGAPVTFRVDVPQGDVQSLWCGVEIPSDAPRGRYSGTVTVHAAGMSDRTVPVSIIVKNDSVASGGIDRPETLTRLHWLNSTMAQENSVIPPYTPLDVKDTTISLLGRTLSLHNNGFPSQIRTWFTPEMTGLSTTPTDLLVEPIHFHFYDEAGKQPLQWKSNGLTFTKKEAGTVSWKAENVSDGLTMTVEGTLEFDGYLSYAIAMTATKDISFKEINLHLPVNPPVNPPVAEYLMGLGQKGGKRPDTLRWKWDVATKNQDGAWIGTVNAGLQFSLRDEKYVRPLNTNFYLQKPLVLPSSWGNDGKGGIDIFQKGRSVLVNAYSGSRTMKKGETVRYDMTMLITPFHPINTDFQWGTRFYHKYDAPESIAATGATVVNIHHATPVNPWINYPFIEWKKLKGYVDTSHANGLKVKIYNTVRELSNRSYELFPMRSLGHEIFSPGKGGGYSWLQEHVGDDYIAAWFVPELKDAAIVNSGMSRWHNYYVEGMNWLVQNAGIDGIYLDDVAFDRVTMKRIKRVLTAGGHPGIVDLHSANQYNKNDGFNNSANLYMEHFPYLNRLWFGEYFDYENNGPDFFLTEVSGIPFGLMGEMLEKGGNPWRGMVYGMTNRMPWSDNADPRPLWKVWDSFSIQGSTMLGYWSPNVPVKTSDPAVLATVYKKEKSALVALASWADSTRSVTLNVNWKGLGIDSAKARITAPPIENFQEARTFSPADSIVVPKGKGWLLKIE